MLISKNTLRSDPRVLCGMIAESTLERLDNTDRPPAVQTHALTLIRMFDAYRVGMRSVESHSGVAAYIPLGLEDDEADEPDYQGAVMQAIDDARVAVCMLGKEEFSSTMTNTLVSAFSVARAAYDLNASNVPLLKRFLGQFAVELQTAK